MIPYGRQSISDADIEAVVEVLRSDFLTQGPAVERFEAAVAAHVGVPHAVAMNSATSALHVACLALGLGPDDVLWTSPNTFVASANCALYCGATVDFVDVEPDTGNMSVSALRERLAEAAASGQLPKIVVPVHFAGHACDMPAIRALSREYGFAVIEDASHAIGGSAFGMPVGRCEHSDVTVFSFHPVKIVTTGEGGMATTRDGEVAARMQMLRSHGITRDAGRMQGESDGGWYYQQLLLGHNYRMTDVAAALGTSQMTRIEEFVARRHAIAGTYAARLRDLPVQLPVQRPAVRSAWHLYVVRVRPDAGRSRREVYDTLRENGIGVNVHYIPVHLQPYYRALGFREGQFPEAERHYAEAISLPMFAALSDESQATVVSQLERSFR